MKRSLLGLTIGLVALAFTACSSLPEERSASARAALDAKVEQEKYQALYDQWVKSRSQTAGQVMLPPGGYFPDGTAFHNGTIFLPNGDTEHYTVYPSGNVIFYFFDRDDYRTVLNVFIKRLAR